MPSSEHVALEKRVAALEEQFKELGEVILGQVFAEPQDGLEERVAELEARLASLEAVGKELASGKKAPARRKKLGVSDGG
jgi:uncharacterized coiled-coil protein SlyX